MDSDTLIGYVALGIFSTFLFIIISMCICGSCIPKDINCCNCCSKCCVRHCTRYCTKCNDINTIDGDHYEHI